MLLCKIIYHV